MFAAGHVAADLRLEAGAGFWPAIEGLVAGDRLGAQLDDLLAGGTSPRTWCVLHEPGEPQLSAAAALLLARALVGRGQNVLVLDVDEAEAALTRWAGRDETEGWIDVARFGASVLGAGLALPFRGGRGLLLGVGSFRPTDANDGEIVSLLGRLRHQADDIILVGAVGPAVVPWARLATRRVLCWDPSVRAADQLARVSLPFDASGAPLTALVAFGEVPAAAGREDAVAATASATESAVEGAADGAVDAGAMDDGALDDAVHDDEAHDVDALDDDVLEVGGLDEDALDEDAPDEGVLDDVASTADGADAGEPDTEADADAVPGEPVPDLVVMYGAGAPTRADGAPATDASPAGPLAPPPVYPRAADLGLGGETETPRQNPRVFWLATGVFAVALLAVAWYWSEYVRVPPGGYFTPVVTHADSTQSTTGTAADGAGDEAARQVATAGGQTSLDDSLSELGGAVASTPAGESGGSTVKPDAQPSAPPASPPSTAAVAFDRAAYDGPVGEAGWALHVYSVPDSAGAVRECAGLERSGFRTAVRIVEIKEKGGRWWRIYVGSFPSRKAAQAAMPALLEKLHANWAEVAPMK